MFFVLKTLNETVRSSPKKERKKARDNPLCDRRSAREREKERDSIDDGYRVVVVSISPHASIRKNTNKTLRGNIIVKIIGRDVHGADTSALSKHSGRPRRRGETKLQVTTKTPLFFPSLSRPPSARWSPRRKEEFFSFHSNRLVAILMPR